MQPDMNLIRDILKRLYVVHGRDPVVITAHYTLDPPFIHDHGSDTMCAHVDLLERSGLLIRTHKHLTTLRPAPATLEPTALTRKWAMCAFDEKWESVSGELSVFLTKSAHEPCDICEDLNRFTFWSIESHLADLPERPQSLFVR
jgi:hypothetical protein